ncbi:MAG: 50S ribosomal protein L15 [Candidatus Berkelbacteria bacterium]|nr:50S ribosomal protein L15 [Candidatus Berkelbacteria bacterium]
MELVSIKSKLKKRVGRGLSSGQGKTAGRGTKGQRSRSGFNIPKRFEGGQTAISMRLPKLPGFTSHKAKALIITLDQISTSFKDGETVSAKSLLEKGIIKSLNTKVKVLNNGELKIKVVFAPEIKVSKSVTEIAVKPEKVAELKTEKTVEVEEKPKAEKAAKPKKSAETK